MPGSGTRTFLDMEDYQAGLRQGTIEAIVTSLGEFKARLSWAELQDTQLLHCEEDFPCVAFLSLPDRLVYVSFPTALSGSAQWAGTQLRAEDIFLHARGERLHRSTTGPFAWSLISLDPASLERYCAALAGYLSPSPPAGKILRPPRRDAARLRRVHAQICRLAETKPKMLTHPEVAYAIEQDLIEALVVCLVAQGVEPNDTKRRRAAIMVKFEEVIAGHIEALLRLPELCELVGVSERVLQRCCAEFIGMGPSRYVTLRRLNWARRALLRAGPNVAEIAQGCGFSDLRRFVDRYEATFGESPSATLRRARGKSFTAR